SRHALDELTRDDLLERTRRALQLNAVIALQQREHFLARRLQQLRDLIDPNRGQYVYSSDSLVAAAGSSRGADSPAVPSPGAACSAGFSSAAASSAPNCASTSRRFSSSLLMSIRHPVSFAARRTFWPFLPIASDNCLSSTTTSITRSLSSTIDTRW